MKFVKVNMTNKTIKIEDVPRLCNQALSFYVRKRKRSRYKIEKCQVRKGEVKL